MPFDLYEFFIFHPKKLDASHVFTFKTPFEEVNLKAKDGAIINAIHFHCPNPKGIIIYFHGNKDNLDRWGRITEPLVATHGYEVLVMDYRGYGKSTGERTEQKMYEDALLCYDFALKRFAADSIVAFGRSLGSGVASWLAANRTVKSLVLETPYYNFDTLARSLFPFLPTRRFLKYHFDNHQNLQRVHCPILLFHGTKDKLIRFSSVVQLYESVRAKDITFVRLEDGRHGNLGKFTAYQAALKDFLK